MDKYYAKDDMLRVYAIANGERFGKEALRFCGETDRAECRCESGAEAEK